MEQKKCCHIFQWFVRVKLGFQIIFLGFRNYYVRVRYTPRQLGDYVLRTS